MLLQKSLETKKINIVAPQDGWVLTDISSKLNDALCDLNLRSSFSRVPDPSADIIHWVGALGNNYFKNKINK